MCPLWVGEGVGALTNPLFHTGGGGGTTRTVERREPTQPGGGDVRKDSLCAGDRVYTCTHVCVYVCVITRAKGKRNRESILIIEREPLRFGESLNFCKMISVLIFCVNLKLFVADA